MAYSQTVPSASYGAGHVSGYNSSTTPLAGGATFVGVEELTPHSDMLISVKSDVAGTLYVDLGTVSGTYDSTLSFDVAAATNEFHTIVKGTRFCRVRYINGSAAQSYFRLHTEFGHFRQANSPLKTAIQQDSDASTVRAITEEVAIASGLFTGYSIVNKFGTNGDIDTATVPEDIWEGGGVYTGFPDATLETVEVLSSSANDTSAGTGARTIQITGLDANYDVQTETITLNGTTPVASVGQYRRVHTATVRSAGSGGVNAGTITVRHSTTEANVFLSLVAGRNQSNCSGYTVPAGHTAYMRSLHVAIRGTGIASTPAAAEGYIWTRTFGQVFRSRRPYVVSSSYRLADVIYGGLVFTEKTDIILRITSSSADNVSVSGEYDLILVKN